MHFRPRMVGWHHRNRVRRGSLHREVLVNKMDNLVTSSEVAIAALNDYRAVLHATATNMKGTCTKKEAYYKLLLCHNRCIPIDEFYKIVSEAFGQ